MIDPAAAYRALAQLARLGASATSPSELAAQALELALEAVGADGGDLCVLAGYQRHALHSSWRDWPANAERAAATEPDPRLVRLLSDGRAVAWEPPAAPESLRSVALQLDYRSCASAPISVGGRPLGVLDCAARRPGAFDESTLELLTAIGALLGPMMDHALGTASPATAELAQNLLELRALQRVAETVSRSLDLDVVLGHSLDIALQVAHAPSGAIYLHDQPRGVYRRVVSRNVPDDVAPPVIPAPGVDARFTNCSSVLIDVDHPNEQKPLLQAPRKHGFRRVFIVALRVEGRMVGVLGLNFYEPVNLLPTTTLTLEAIAGQEAVAIENARAHQLVELRARLALVLREFGERALVPGDREGLYRLVLETALKLTRSDRGLISRIYDRRSRVVAGIGKDAQLVGVALSIDADYLAESIAQPGPVIVEDTSQIASDSAIGQVAKRQDTRSFILLTFRYHGQPLGQLFAGSGVQLRYEEAEIEAMQLLASMAGEVLERARVQAEAEAERSRYDATIEHLPIVVAVVNRKGETLHVNAAGRAFVQRFGAPSQQTWHESMMSIKTFAVDGRQLQPDELPVVRAFAGEHPPARELLVVSPDGERRVTVLAVAAPLPSDEPGVVDAVVTGFQDVSGLRELADAKDRFLRVASHELRSPITSLRATTALLEMDPTAITDPERRNVMLQRIKRQVDRLIKLVEQLIDSARLNATEVPIQATECDLTAVAREAIELACSATPSRVVILDAAGPLIGRWDPLRLEQVLSNLVGNALRYSPEGSEVRVQLTGCPGTAIVKVIDSGIGIPTEQLDKVFTPFFRGSNAALQHRGGLGLGLHITAEIVRRHGGTVAVDSTVGKGTVFTVELPRTRPQ